MNKKRRSRYRKGFLICFLAIISALAILYILHSDKSKRIAGEGLERENELKRTAHRIYRSPDLQKKPATPELISPAKKKIAIIIDDIGCDLAPVRELLSVDAPIAFSILPYCPYSLEASEMIHRTGKEVLLHLPMEPHAYPEVKPGPGTLLLSMEDHELRQQMEKDIHNVHYIKGVNNHMGSKFMEDEGKLSVVLSYLKKKGFYFVDSRTTSHSKGQEVSKKIGLRFLSRDVFIDNNQDYTFILDTLNHLSEKKDPQNKDPFLIIGHPYPSTIEALKKAIPHLKAKGIDIVPVSEMIDIAARKNKFSFKGALFN